MTRSVPKLWHAGPTDHVVTAIDGHEILNQDSLYRVLDLHEVGDTLRLKVLRDQKTLEVSVTLQALPSTAP